MKVISFLLTKYPLARPCFSTIKEVERTGGKGCAIVTKFCTTQKRGINSQEMEESNERDPEVVSDKDRKTLLTKKPFLIKIKRRDHNE